MTDTAGTDSGILSRCRFIRTPGHGNARRKWLLTGFREEPAAGYTGLYEDPDDPDRIGICCSGGGIRSAAFNLGALQALQASDVLRRTAYVSAVSGGSYIASAFCMVAKTSDRGEKADSDPDAFDGEHGPPFAPGSPEEQYLRNHLSYLAPTGLAKLYLAMRMVGGLLVNVLLIGLPVLIAGLLAGLLLDGLYDGIADGHIAVPGYIWIPIVVVAGLAAALAVLDVVWRPGKDIVQTASQTWEVRLLLAAGAAAVVLVAVPWLAALAARPRDVTVGEAAVRSAGTAFSSVVALAIAAYTHARGAVRDRQKIIDAAKHSLGKYVRRVREVIVALVVMLAGPLLLIAVAVFGVLLAVQSEDKGATLLIVVVGVLVAMSLFVDLTTVSLHPFYRRRLASAFALRRVFGDKARSRVIAEERPFDELVTLSKTDVGHGWPTLIVCAAANISDPGATPPGRSVASFTFSHAAIGGPLTGAALTTDYEALHPTRQRDVTLPAAVAMSGAAVSPSMGKLTYRPLTFLLALANIRLGVWVPNPRYVNDPSTSLAGRLQRPRPHYLWKELFGRNRLEDKFLYVTDGGHYENLGLVELLRRGCRTIYCFDAGGGSPSKALGDAIALARAELDVTIEMDDTTRLLKESADGSDVPPRSKAVCAVGTIQYPDRPKDEPPGRLFYVRSVVSEDSPWDLQDYQVVDGVFPHHSTVDQFFNDQRFEAYRRLGWCAATRAHALAEPRIPLQRTPAPAPIVTGAGLYSATGKLKLELEPE